MADNQVAIKSSLEITTIKNGVVVKKEVVDNGVQRNNG
ncbi:hypothetical protein FA11_0967 [Pelosinus fermentans A11]|uniref:Uncharacterized protein n=1 Tax=Pelosinus fermentans B4 TaxID=1149862 RepID=I8RIZ7_9FIRM|nr:hypothetical protein FB4_0154 [Pelosinus fermentans B4]EIW21240.1 hypothetical protein FA11_0967 [Pelosinus fermentans A11]